MSQKNVFKKVAEKYDRCFVCWDKMKDPYWNYTDDFYPYMFAHILAKWYCKRHKFNENNICLVCDISHHKVIDRATKWIKKQLIDKLDKWEDIYWLVKERVDKVLIDLEKNNIKGNLI